MLASVETDRDRPDRTEGPRQTETDPTVSVAASTAKRWNTFFTPTSLHFETTLLHSDGFISFLTTQQEQPLAALAFVLLSRRPTKNAVSPRRTSPIAPSRGPHQVSFKRQPWWPHSEISELILAQTVGGKTEKQKNNKGRPQR